MPSSASATLRRQRSSTSCSATSTTVVPITPTGCDRLLRARAASYRHPDDCHGRDCPALGVDPCGASKTTPRLTSSPRSCCPHWISSTPTHETPAVVTAARHSVSQVQAKAVTDLLLRGSGPADRIAWPLFGTLQRAAGVWERLDDDIQTILVTAEYFGATAPDGADLSGPLLGICAAFERLLCENDRVFARLQEHLPACALARDAWRRRSSSRGRGSLGPLGIRPSASFPRRYRDGRQKILGICGRSRPQRAPSCGRSHRGDAQGALAHRPRAWCLAPARRNGRRCCREWSRRSGAHSEHAPASSAVLGGAGCQRPASSHTKWSWQMRRTSA